MSTWPHWAVISSFSAASLLLHPYEFAATQHKSEDHDNQYDNSGLHRMILPYFHERAFSRESTASITLPISFMYAPANKASGSMSFGLIFSSR